MPGAGRKRPLLTGTADSCQSARDPVAGWQIAPLSRKELDRGQGLAAMEAACQPPLKVGRLAGWLDPRRPRDQGLLRRTRRTCKVPLRGGLRLSRKRLTSADGGRGCTCPYASASPRCPDDLLADEGRAAPVESAPTTWSAVCSASGRVRSTPSGPVILAPSGR